MKEETEDSFAECTGQMVFCPRCGKKHYSHTVIMDEYVNCVCGMRFYAFADSGLRIILPPDEAGYEPIARAMRRFVVTTGRCRDIPPELYQNDDGQICFNFVKKDEDVEERLARSLEQFQQEMFGECFISKDLVFAICESFLDGHDVELRKQKKGVDIIKLIRKRMALPEKKHMSKNYVNRNTPIENSIRLLGPGLGIMWHYQKDKPEPSMRQ